MYLVGAGPGDPELLTLRAAAVLSQADVVLADDLVGEGVKERFSRGAAWIPCSELGPSRDRSARLNAMIIDCARAGKRVVHLKGGDPFVFGRLGEEMEALTSHGVPFAVIPGVSSVSAAAAALGVPLTRRGVAAGVTFLAGTRAPGSEEAGLEGWHAAGAADRTIAVFMGVSRLPEIGRTLIAQGMDPSTPSAIVERASRPDARITRQRLDTLCDTAARADVRAPAMLLIGRVLDVLPGKPAATRDSRARSGS